MTEILYRAKAINRERGYHRTDYKNGDWVYGLITKPYDERFKSLPAEMRDVDGVNGIEVDYKTVGQYTGLTDKNGTKVFEGDIIAHYSFGEVHIDGVVKYGTFNCSCCEGVYGWYIDGGDIRSLKEEWDEECSTNCYIIGNIHDNPELLGGGKYV